MLKYAGLLAVLLVACFSLLTVFAMPLGWGAQPPIVTVVIKPPGPLAHHLSAFQWIDLDRRVWVEFRPPVPDVRDIVLHDTRPEALILTRRYDTDEKTNYYHFYHHDLQTQQTLLLFRWDGDSFGSAGYQAISRDYAPRWSPDGEKVAFYNPMEKEIQIFDLQNGERSGVVAMELEITRSDIVWSPDGEQIAVRPAPLLTGTVISSQQPSFIDTLIVFAADGSNMREFPHLRVGGFRPRWSHNSRDVLLTYAGSGARSMQLVRVLNTHTGAFNPITEGLRATMATWCDGRQLVYTTVVDELPRLRVLEMATGEMHDLTENTPFTDYGLGGLMWTPDCTRLLGLGRAGLRGLQPMLYEITPDAGDERIVQAGAVLVGLDDDGVIYQTTDETADGGWSRLYRRDFAGDVLEIGRIWPQVGGLYDWFDGGRRALMLNERRQLRLIGVDQVYSHALTDPQRVITQYQLWR